MSDIIPFGQNPFCIPVYKIPFMDGHNPLHVFARLGKIPVTKSPDFIGF
jgi:hypothetical protein